MVSDNLKHFEYASKRIEEEKNGKSSLYKTR